MEPPRSVFDDAFAAFHAAAAIGDQCAAISEYRQARPALDAIECTPARRLMTDHLRRAISAAEARGDGTMAQALDGLVDGDMLPTTVDRTEGLVRWLVWHHCHSLSDDTQALSLRAQSYRRALSQLSAASIAQGVTEAADCGRDRGCDRLLLVARTEYRRVFEQVLREACHAREFDCVQAMFAGPLGGFLADPVEAFVCACIGGDLCIVRWAHTQGEKDLGAEVWQTEALRAARQIFARVCARGHLDVAQHLYQLGLSLAEIRANDCKAFWWACGRGRLEVAQWLLTQGLELADVRAGGTFRPLRRVYVRGHLAMAQWLWSLGLEPKDSAGLPAGLAAAAGGGPVAP